MNNMKNMDQKVVEETAFTREPIYKRFSIFLIGLMLITLLPHYSKLLDETIDVPWRITLHGALYLVWFILFAVQSNLSNRNTALHKKTGYLSIALVVLLFISGADLLAGIMRGYSPDWNPEFLRSRTTFVWAIAHTLGTFTGFYLLGAMFRKKLHLHKRFMLMASLSMISASVTRVAFLPFIPINGMLLTLGTTYLLLLCPVVIDRLSFGKVHTVFKWAVPLYIVTQILCIGFIPGTYTGQVMAFPF